MCNVEVFNYYCGCQFNIVDKKCAHAVAYSTRRCTDVVVKRHLHSAVKCGYDDGSFIHRVAYVMSLGF
jgi:hypothetical protein